MLKSRGMLGLLKNLFDSNEKEVKRYLQSVAKINALEPDVQKLSDDELRAKTVAFKSVVAKEMQDYPLSEYQGKPRYFSVKLLEPVAIEALAVVREAIRRTVGERAFDVQLAAALSLHEGKIAEQKTGEGKTLSSVMAMYLNGLTGFGVHLVTVNDYLAQRDAGWYGKALDFLGLKVGVIIHDQSFIYDPEFDNPQHQDERLKHHRPVSRQEAYNADVTYGTNNEYGFDYLRDNMVYQSEQKSQRGHNFAIVDEVDSILIDEARTPLIISAPAAESNELYQKFGKIVPSLNSQDYILEEKEKSIHLSDLGIKKMEKVLGIANLFDDWMLTHHLDQALKANFIYLKDRDYIVKDNEVIIVDEFTGRLMPGRRFSEGLHQAIEAKEKVTIQKESKTLATITFQNYFRLYQKLSGMTGTAATESEEFHKIYDLEVVVVPTNKTMIRADQADRIYKHQRAKWKAIVDEIEECHKKGQPVLVGTTSVEKNELLHTFLDRRGIAHEILNAKNHEREAEIIVKAGLTGSVTVATNMAGRGTDIRLGLGVVELGGLHVIGTERHEARRIDNQLRGRSGRQGDPGSSRFFVALDDDLMRIFGGDKIASLMTTFNLPEDLPLEAGMVSKAIENAQMKVEGYNFDIRKHLVEYDDVINKQREIIYKKREMLLTNFQFSSTNFQTNSNDQNSKTEEEKSDLQNETEIYNLEPITYNLHDQLLEKIRKFSENPDTAINRYSNKEQRIGMENIKQIERMIYLTTLDELWMDHIDALDELRLGIGLRGWGQMDPLVEFKKEAYAMFERLLLEIDQTVVDRLLHFEIAPTQMAPVVETARMQEARGRVQGLGDRGQGIGSDGESAGSLTSSTPIVRSENEKLGRNDPCWCGSGKKYKHCHGK